MQNIGGRGLGKGKIVICPGKLGWYRYLPVNHTREQRSLARIGVTTVKEWQFGIDNPLNKRILSPLCALCLTPVVLHFCLAVSLLPPAHPCFLEFYVATAMQTPPIPIPPSPQWTNGVQLAWCSSGPWANMEQKLWAQTLILALLKPQLHFFYKWTTGNRTLEMQGLNSTQIQISVCVSEISFSRDIARTPSPAALSWEKNPPPPFHQV